MDPHPLGVMLMAVFILSRIGEEPAADLRSPHARPAAEAVLGELLRQALPAPATTEIANAEGERRGSGVNPQTKTIFGHGEA
jgi:hypothetical protein